MKKLYLVATYYKVPRYPKMSSQKDFGKDQSNWAFNESVEIARTIKRRDQQQANIILNLTEQKVEKCNMRDDNPSYDELHRYFKNNYPQYFQHIDSLQPTVEVTAQADQPKSDPAVTA
jgi:hypothetical protein